MLSILKPKSRRIFLINLQGLSVFSMQANRLTHIARFSDEESGYENFRNYLAENAQTPVTIVVDSISEDFIVERVPHVNPMDRKSFLQRKLDQHYRGIDYRTAQVIGREGTGRKNDKVLFSAINKNQALEPWVRALLQQEIPIRSITTPAYALCKLAQEKGLLTEDRVLLVNWEVSGIRHTYIESGKTLFSRLTPLPSSDESDLADAIIDSCNQSNDYLERIGLVGFDESMAVQVITPQLPDDIFADIPSNRNFSSIVHHNSIDMMDDELFTGPDESVTAIMLSLDWGMREGEFPNIYAPSPALRFLELYSARRVIVFLALAVLIAGAASGAPLLLDGIERQLRVSEIQDQTNPVQSQYNALTAQFPETPIPSEALELAVGTYDLIERQVESPFTIMAAFSQVLERFPTVRLSSLEWRLSSPEETETVTQVLLGGSARPQLEIAGFLRGSRSIGDSDRVLRQFINDLNAIDGLSAVPVSLPVQEGPEAALSTVIDDSLVDVQFAIRVSRDS